MTPWETLLIAVALGCDAFAVGLGVGTRYSSPAQTFRLAFHFGLFQFLMPLLGWVSGTLLLSVAQRWGPWLAALVLLFIGGRMTYESVFGSAEEGTYAHDPTRGWTLLVLSVATSLDALGVGLSFGILGRKLWAAAVCIGVTAFVMTWTAVRIGGKLSALWGRRMGALGGIILIGIAWTIWYHR